MIELKDVSKTYELGETSLGALKNINLKIKDNEIISILGPSGCGKSTLLNLIGCLDVPSVGKVLIDDKDVSKYDSNELAKLRREKIGFVFQFFYLIPNLTIQENVELPMIFANKPDREKRAAELLKMVGLGSRLESFPYQLSGGERQRVAIARAIANKPEIVLADEPTGNLDSKTGQEVMKILTDLHKHEKITLIIVTHDQNLAKTAEKIIYLKDGEIIKVDKR